MNTNWDVYLITNVINGKKYVGITSYGFKKRFQKHINESKHKDNRILCKAIRKYGKENFRIQLLETVESKEEAYRLERFYIKKYNSFAYFPNSNGYNQTRGGDGVEGHVLSKSQKKLLSRLRTKEGRWKGEKNPNFGKGFLMQGKLHFNYGKHLSQETKNKISKANKGKMVGTKNPSCKKCVCFAKEIKTGTIEKFDSFYDLISSFNDRKINLNRACVLGVMRGDRGRKSYKGYTFYREDVTPNNLFKTIEIDYESNTLRPFLINREGTDHPNAKNLECYAFEIHTNKIYKFDSWFELKTTIEKKFSVKLLYSEIRKVADGRCNSSKGFKFYRQDVTDSQLFQDIQNKYIHQNKPSTTIEIDSI